MKSILSIYTLSILATLPVYAEPASEKDDSAKLIPGGGMNMTSEEYEGTILKVYSAKTKSGSNYNGYVVKWNGSEVVISDMFGGKTKSVGDKIEFMVQEMEMPMLAEVSGNGRGKMIQFILIPGFDVEQESEEDHEGSVQQDGETDKPGVQE